MVLEKKSNNEKKRMAVNILVWTSLVGTEPRASTKTMPQEEPGGGGGGSGAVGGVELGCCVHDCALNLDWDTSNHGHNF